MNETFFAIAYIMRSETSPSPPPAKNGVKHILMEIYLVTIDRGKESIISPVPPLPFPFFMLLIAM